MRKSDYYLAGVPLVLAAVAVFFDQNVFAVVSLVAGFALLVRGYFHKDPATSNDLALKDSLQDAVDAQLTEVIELAQQIQRFLAETQPNFDASSRPGDMAEATRLYQRDHQHFMSEYSRRFSGKVLAFHIVLDRLGAGDESSILYSNPTNALGIRWVAERFLARAELIRQERKGPSQ